MTRFLQNISIRERVMLGALVVICLLIWASILSSRWEESAETLANARKTVKQQKVWLDSEPLFQAQLDQSLALLDPDAMLDGTALSAYIDSYAREHKLKHEMTTPAIQSSKLYSSASMRVTLRNITLDELIRFQIELDAKRPYIAVEAIALAANRADPRLLNARLNLTSLTIHSDAAPGS